MFDPYRKWLGILPKDQPPNHYRLLSLELFEHDLDVIEGAADRAMGFIRQYQSGEHAGLAAKLLNEVATARLCLLKPTSKSEYDAQLRLKLVVPQIDKGDGVSFSFDPELASLLRAPQQPLEARAKSKSTALKTSPGIWVGGAVGAGVLVLLGVLILNRGGQPQRNVKPVLDKGEPVHPEIAESNPNPASSLAWPSTSEPAVMPKVEAVAESKPPLESNPVVEAIGPSVDPIVVATIPKDPGNPPQTVRTVPQEMESTTAAKPKPVTSEVPTSKSKTVKKPIAASKWKGWPKGAPPLAIAPFTAEEVVKHQEAWAKYMKVDVEYTNKIGMRFSLVPPGEFLMGTPPAELEAVLKATADTLDQGKTFKSEAPQHRVILTHPFYMGIHEVTQSQYQNVMGANPANFSKLGNNKDAVAGIDVGDNPVETVSWIDAAEFCARLSVFEKRHPFYERDGDKVMLLDGNGYRVPSEAEWEFACRAGTTSKFWNGSDDEDMRKMNLGWSWGSRTQTVGQLKANPFGIYDMIGNVREWTDDYWDAAWYGNFKDTPAINPRCPQLTNSDRVVRGGCIADGPSTCRSSARMARPSGNRGSDIGFRVSLPITAAKK